MDLLNQATCILKESKERFGGVLVLPVGDLGQLAPVSGY
jgi:hypothetical protein